VPSANAVRPLSSTWMHTPPSRLDPSCEYSGHGIVVRGVVDKHPPTSTSARPRSSSSTGGETHASPTLSVLTTRPAQRTPRAARQAHNAGGRTKRGSVQTCTQ